MSGGADPREISRPDDEIILIQAAKTGDPEAFASLFRAYRSRIFAFARRYFAPGYGHDDLLQEATIGFFKAIRDFKGNRGSFGSFAELCVHRHIITVVRTATRQKHAVLNRATSLDAPAFIHSDEQLIGRLAAPEHPSIVHDTAVSDFLDELWRRCSALERGVLSTYSQGYHIDEIARELGVQSKSIDNAVWRIKVKAKKLNAEQPLCIS